MTNIIVVREYARLTTAQLTAADISIDQAQISATAFDWLCDLAANFRSSGAQLLQVDNRRWLKLDNYVGVLESPCGQVIEVLPKLFTADDCVDTSRQLLVKLISNALQLTPRQAGEASLSLYQWTLTEWVMQQFLLALEHLLKRGMRFEYQRVEEEQRYLRGQLNVVAQMRQPPGRQHHFQIRHDVFVPDRPENRLLKSALKIVCKAVKHPGNWRLAHELMNMLHEVPESADINADFNRWRNDRLLAHYQPARPWCELVLYQHMPLSITGGYRGISMLFPMEKLFESYVAVELRKAAYAFGDKSALNTQLRQQSLCSFSGQPVFLLKPDLELCVDDRRWIMDTKWKLLDMQARDNKFQLSQTDFYQMFAYGHKYQHGHGTLVLIYPAWQKYPATTAPLYFKYSDTLNLMVLPFDLTNKNSALEFVDLLCREDKMAKLQLEQAAAF